VRRSRAERAEAREALLAPLRDCGPEGNATLEILCSSSEASSTGRTERIEIRVLRATDEDGGRPRHAEWLTRNVARALGWRYSERHEALLMGGYGYCRATQVAEALARLVGHALFCDSVNFFGGPRGWHPAVPEKRPGVRKVRVSR